MAKENEPAKLLLPYLQRADELQKHDPLVAYYCRLYAMERGLSIPQSQRTKTTNSLLVSLMNQLEKDRKSLRLGPDDNLHLEGFALNVFAKADKQDHAGKADLNTAKTFYAASIFFEILNQFGELQSDLEQKQKYAAWKAADIRKALKEGRRPVPGPPGNENDLSMPSISPTSENDLGLRQSDSALRPAPESDISSQFYDKVNPQHSTSILPSPPSHMPISTSLPPLPPSDVPPSPHSRPPPSPHSNLPPSPSYPADDYSPHNFHQPSPTSGHENSTYPQMYHHQPYMQEPQQQSPHNYPSHEASAYSYPNFQSYPSFTDTSLPASPTHYPSYYQDCDGSYMNPTAPNVNYPSAAQYSSSNRNGSVSEAAPTPPQTYQYDINYQPPPEKIAEAHKAARFAVGALAFDDVSVAVDYLRKSFELLTIPSASH